MSTSHIDTLPCAKPQPKAYQFIEGRPSVLPKSQDTDKENELLEDTTDAVVKCSTLEASRISHETGIVSPAKLLPSTPATRLPLADLIGNTDEDTSIQLDVDISPEDYIHWQSKRSPATCSRSKVTPNNNPKKRARSSSPPSSQCGSSRQLLAEREPLDLHSLQQTLGPQIDPVADLWSRYTINSTRETPAAIPAQHLSHLLDTSSPQSAYNNSGSVSGLRRWTSCGVEWPSANRKRQKIRNLVARDELEDVFADLPVPLAKDATVPKVSRIGNLVERIQENLLKPSKPEEPYAPSSSSPLPDRSENYAITSISPSRQQAISSLRTDGQHPKDTSRAICTAKMKPYASVESKLESSSSFDDDLDMNAFENAQDLLREARPSNDVSKTMLLLQQPTPAVICGDLEDEFGSDEDFSAADFDVVASAPNDGILLRNRERSPKRHDFASDNEFDDDGIDEASFVAAEAAATQSHSISKPDNSSNAFMNRAIQRYLVKNVYEGEYNSNSGRKCPEKVLSVEDEKSKLCKAIMLRQCWFDTACTIGSYVHVVGEFSETGQCIVDDAQNLLVLHPDHLISATVVADSFDCIRRAVLQDRIKATSEITPPLLYGTLLHEIFQEALASNRWDSKSLSEKIRAVTYRHVEEVYAVKLSMPKVFEYLESKMSRIQAWANIFVKAEPASEAVIEDRNDSHVTLSVSKLLDVEEHIWSPTFGLKGNIDATVQVTMKDKRGKRNLAVPLEIKTGRNKFNAAHRAQTALYTLLLSDRYDIDVQHGLLYYLETSEISRIAAVRRELVHMIMQRNELACFVSQRLSLPPMLKQSHRCNTCYAQTSCFVYHKLAEDGNGDTSGMGERFDEAVRHLSSDHQAFFQKWDELLTKEESEIMKFRRELWTMLSSEREKVGRCFSNVMLEPGSKIAVPDDSKISRFQYAFVHGAKSGALSFTESQITVGEPVVISDENGHYALARGYVTDLRKQRISVAVDRQLHRARTRLPGFNEDTNQNFAGIMIADDSNDSYIDTKDHIERASLAQKFRLDKDEFSNGMATVRNNLIQIMARDVFRAQTIRGLLIDGATPRFRPTSSAYNVSGPESRSDINEDQKKAIEKILTAQDYALILGMPGTGKTTTIAHIIRALVARGKTVLLASYTHTAVDNILLKIRGDNIGILRLGSAAKIHSEVREFAMLAAETKSSIEQIEKSYQEPQVVATTCLGINHKIFNERIFDYCIVDEASQITLPVCLGPIRMAKVFVLVGDHYQLPPLVQNEAAREGGLDVSLFKLLSARHPSAVVTLSQQYRMNKDIMSLSNRLIYDGRLSCGNMTVATRRLEVPNLSALRALHHESLSSSGKASSSTRPCKFAFARACWLVDVLRSDSSPVVFLNTDSLLPTSRESVNSRRISNHLEASVTAQLVRAFLSTGVHPSHLGVVTLYRSQLALIKSLLRSPKFGIPIAEADAVEAHTADRYQGRDKDIIILSCVRSNESKIVGELLKDWRRVNVALTRAKKKLIILGSQQTLSGGDVLLRQLIEHCEAKGWVYNLPHEARDEGSHLWNQLDFLSSSSAVSRASKETENLETHKRENIKIRVATDTDLKMPSKRGTVAVKAVLGPNVRRRRPILADIINDAVGEHFLD